MIEQDVGKVIDCKVKVTLASFFLPGPKGCLNSTPGTTKLWHFSIGKMF